MLDKTLLKFGLSNAGLLGALDPVTRAQQPYITRLLNFDSANLVAGYPLAEDANDASINGYNGTPSNVTFVDDPLFFGAGYSSYNGTSSAISVPTTIENKMDFDEMTALAWIKPDAAVWAGSAFTYVYQFGEDAANRYSLNTASTANFMNFAGRRQDVNGVYLSVTDAAMAGVWSCVTTTISKSGSVARLFVNGTLIGTDTSITNDYVGDVNTYHHIGSNDGSAFWWKGGIGPLFFWSRAFTPVEVARVSR